MSIISKGTRFLGISPNVQLRLSPGNRNEPFTIENIINSVRMSGPAITFFTDSEYKVESKKINGYYYLLGVDFSNFDFQQGYEYTLLIDRYKARESRGRMRPSGYYHADKVAPAKVEEGKEEKKAEKKGQIDYSKRLNELPIKPIKTSQMFDFGQDYYFSNNFPNFSGKKKKKNNSNSLSLGFRVRITDKSGRSVETNHIGFVDMVGTICTKEEMFTDPDTGLETIRNYQINIVSFRIRGL